MTGRGMGYCAGNAAPGAVSGFGRGYGMGLDRGWGGGGRSGGGGWGFRNMYYATGVPGWGRVGYAPAFGAVPVPPTSEQEAAYLENQVGLLRGELGALEGRLAELQSKGEGEQGG